MTQSTIKHGVPVFLPEQSLKVGRGGQTFSLMPVLHLNVVQFCKGTIKEGNFPEKHSLKAPLPSYIMGVSTGRTIF